MVRYNEMFLYTICYAPGRPLDQLAIPELETASERMIFMSPLSL